MSKTVWKVFIQYDGWYRVDWAPTFDTKEEADEWISEIGNDDGWDGPVEAVDFEEED